MPDTHEPYIRESIALSKSAVEKGNEPFGALLVVGEQVLLRAENTVYTGGDVTNHAEMNLVREAIKQYAPEDLYDCTLYTSTEPCPMCSGAIYWSGIGQVVYACSVQRLAEIAGAGLDMPCRTIFDYGAQKVDVIGPVLEHEAERIHLDYWSARD